MLRWGLEVLRWVLGALGSILGSFVLGSLHSLWVIPMSFVVLFAYFDQGKPAFHNAYASLVHAHMIKPRH